MPHIRADPKSQEVYTYHPYTSMAISTRGAEQPHDVVNRAIRIQMLTMPEDVELESLSWADADESDPDIAPASIRSDLYAIKLLWETHRGTHPEWFDMAANIRLAGSHFSDRVEGGAWRYAYVNGIEGGPRIWARQRDIATTLYSVAMECGYDGVLIRGFFALIFGVAGRPKEIVGEFVDDLDLEGRRFFIRHPKGEGSYGLRQWVPIIREDMIPRLETFIIERKQALEGKEGEALFLFQSLTENAPYGLKTIRKYKSKVEEVCGFEFKLKSFRSSYATITYQHGGAEMKDAISKQMRHSSTRTTEAYYIAFDASEAAERLKGEWRKSEIVRRGS